MRHGFLCLLGLAAATALMTTPAAAWGDYWGGWFFEAPPSFAYQNPNGTYPSAADLSRAVNGVPCGVECTAEADVRWGLAPPWVLSHHHQRHYHYPY